MSQSVIFSVGVFVFMLVVWGTVMVGGFWMDRLESEAQRAQARPQPSGDAAGVIGAPARPPSEG